MRYHQIRRPLLAVAPRLSDAERNGALLKEIARIARATLDALPKPSPSDRQFLYDLQRDDRRLSSTGLARLIALASQCPNDTDAFALSRAFEAITRLNRPRRELSLAEAIERETHAQSAADEAEVHLALHPSDLSALLNAERATAAHLDAERQLLDSLQRRRAELEFA